MHLAAARHLILADNWNVVLRLARDRARVATDARTKIDDHSPRVPAVFVFIRIIKRFLVCWLFLRVRDAFWIEKEFRQCPAAQKIAAFHLLMLLRCGEGMFFPGLANR